MLPFSRHFAWFAVGLYFSIILSTIILSSCCPFPRHFAWFAVGLYFSIILSTIILSSCCPFPRHFANRRRRRRWTA